MAGFNIGSVVAKIGADISGFKNGLKDAQSEVNGFKSRLENIGESIADIGHKAQIFTGIVAAGFAIVAKNAIESAANFEQNRIAFEVMLGSAEKAKQLLGEISTFAKETPFDLPQLVEGGKRLLAYNVESEKLIPTLEMLGNLAAGVGMDKLPNLILAFGQVKAATKLTGMELRQFSEAGVPLLQALVDEANKGGGMLVKVGDSASKAKVDVKELNDKLAIASQRLKEATDSGKAKQSTIMSLTNTVENYKEKIAGATKETGNAGATFKRVKMDAKTMIEAISDGSVSFDQVQKALSNLTGEGGRFFNLMEKQSKTFNGVVSNIKDSIGIMMRGFLGIDTEGTIAEGSIFAKLRDGAFALMNALQAITPYVAEFAGNMMDKINSAFGRFAEILQPLGKWIQEHQELVITFLKGLAIGLGALIVIGTITTLIGALMNPLTWVVVAITALYTAWQTNFLGIQDITKTVVDAISWFFDNTLKPAVAMVVAFVQNYWGILSAMTKFNFDLIVGIIKIAWNIISGIIEVAVLFITGHWKEAWDVVKQKTENVWNILKDIFNSAKDFIGSWAGAIRDKLVQPFSDAWNKIKGYVEKIKDALDFTQRHSPSVVDIVNMSVRKVNDALSGLDFNTNIMPKVSQIATAPALSTPNFNQITVSLPGAIIANEMAAREISEMIGDNIIKKLQQNVRT